MCDKKSDKKTQTISVLFTLFIFFGLSCCLPFGDLRGASGGTLSLVLKDRAVVSDAIIRIKDIASMNAPARERIGNLVIAVSPELGGHTFIPKNEIMEKLIGNGFSISPGQMKGAATVKVVRKGMVVKPAFFKDQIHRYITRHSKWKEGITVNIVTSKDIVVPQSGIRWQLVPANGQDFFGNILFKVQAITINTNEIIYSNWIVAKLKIVKQVAISNRSINKNEPISSTDLRWETREITAFTKSAIFDKAGIIGEKAGRVIRPNTVITARLLEKKHLVRRGGAAMLVAKSNNIQATSRVRVLANGGLGDTVRVMNSNSKKIISATVTGKNRVEVTVE
ncbi:MAG: flagellar basal body P-ring formation protein FlgA [bacterium]|nr:flagellar basal body P-ring formation protein FlgA [bacterium]